MADRWRSYKELSCYTLAWGWWLKLGLPHLNFKISTKL